jgi:hypothetical protein
LCAAEFKLPRFAELILTTLVIKDYGLRNLILRFPETISRRIYQYSFLVEIFERTKKYVEILNPKIEAKGWTENLIYSAETAELTLEIKHRILESIHEKQVEYNGPEVRLFYGFAPSPHKALVG